MKPFRIEVHADCAFSREALCQNAAMNVGHPRIQAAPPHGRKLAVVGGGPCVLNDLEELRAWDGDVWGINHTAQWLNENGVCATLFSVDPYPFVADVPDAILASACDPGLVRSLSGRVRLFDLVETDPRGMSGGCFSSTRAPSVALYMGYTQLHIFGCEGSWTGQHDHVDRNETLVHQIIVRAGDRDYFTTPQFLVQCEELLKLFFFDAFIFNRSHGLLKAMSENPDTWEVVAVSADLKQHLEDLNGPQGLYEHPYQPVAA